MAVWIIIYFIVLCNYLFNIGSFTRATVHTWKPEDDLQELALSYLVVSQGSNSSLQA